MFRSPHSWCKDYNWTTRKSIRTSLSSSSYTQVQKCHERREMVATEITASQDFFLIGSSIALWLDSPFAASVLGNLDCKKAAISLSSSLSLWRRTFLCFSFVRYVALRFLLNVTGLRLRETKATGWADESSGEDFNLLHMVRVHSCIYTHNPLLSPFSHAHWTVRERGLSHPCSLSETSQYVAQRYSVTLTSACLSEGTANLAPQKNSLSDGGYYYSV